MDVKISPSPLVGQVTAVSSKSDAHRLLICAALCSGQVTLLHIPQSSRDIDATVRVLKAAGADIEREGQRFRVTGAALSSSSPLCDCGESGSTLRFLLPVVSALCAGGIFQGSGKLPCRPIEHLVDAMGSHGVSFSSPHLPFSINGRLLPGIFEIPGNVSSQYISGLLMAMPLIGGGDIRLTTPLESSAYVDMTLSTMARFGVTVEPTEAGWHVPCCSHYSSPGEITAQGDWSNGAFFLAGGAIGGNVSVIGLSMDSIQGDKAVASILNDFGADIRPSDGVISASFLPMHGVDIDISQIPDLLPILAVTAAFAKGTTRFYGGARLRLKESDRLSAVSAMLRSLGCGVTEEPSGLIIRGSHLLGGTVDGFNDHRIVMSAAIAGAYCSGPVTIIGAQAVEKSYPNFFDDLQSLGGVVDVL